MIILTTPCRKYVTLCLLTLCASLIGSERYRVFAQENPHSDRLAQQLLIDYWSGNVATQRLAAKTYESYEKGVDSPDLDLAYVLNRLKYNKNRAALPVSERLAQRSTNTDIWYAHIWLQLANAKIDQSLLLMQRFKEQILSTANLDDGERLEVYGRLGRLFGFAEGPGGGKVNQATLDTTLTILLDGVGDDDRKRFENQRAHVVTSFQKLMNETNAQIEAAAQNDLEQKQHAIAQLNDDNAQINSRQHALNDRADKLREQAAKEINQLDEEMAPLESDLNRLGLAIETIHSDIAFLSGDLAIIELTALGEHDPCKRNRLFHRASHLRRSLRIRQDDLYPLNDQYVAKRTRYDQLLEQSNSVHQRTSSQIDLFARESNQLAKSLKQNDRQLNRLSKPKLRSGLKHARTAKARHLPTYDPFPVDELKQRLLKRL